MHTLWISWLPAVFPSIWLMFALAGSLTAASLERGTALGTVRSRMRRLLPPLWALGAVAVPLMFAHGWLADAASPLRWRDLAWWVVPLANPPASGWGGPFTIALWYLRAYLWLVLVSAPLWWSFRRWPVPTLLALPAIAVLLYSPLVDLPVNPIGDSVWSTASYGTCWLLGYARHTGLLDRVPVRWFALIAGATAVAGMVWGATHQRPDQLADMLWGCAYVLVLMRIRPDLGWLDRVPWLDRLIAVLNARAVTIYVWHVPVTFATGVLLDAVGLRYGNVGVLVAGTVLVAGVVLAVGWVEDVAARRRPALLPAVARPARQVGGVSECNKTANAGTPSAGEPSHRV